MEQNKEQENRPTEQSEVADQAVLSDRNRVRGLTYENGEDIYEGDLCNVHRNPHHGKAVVKYGIYKLKEQTKHDVQNYHIGWYLEFIEDCNKGNIVSLVDAIKGHILKRCPFGQVYSVKRLDETPDYVR